MTDVVLVNTQFAKQQVCSLGCPNEKVVVLPQGLPIEEYDFYHRKPPTVEFEPLRLLSVGRFQREKGHRYAIVAIKRLIDRGWKVSYEIAGVGEGFTELQNLCSKLGISANVRFHKDLQSIEIRNLMASAHLFLLPSIQTSNPSNVETQGVVIQEAQACGCIPIATNVGGIPECIHDGIDAILVKDKSSRAIVSAIDYLFSNPEKWRSMQDKGRKNVEINFSADKIGKEMVAILMRTVATSKQNNQL